MSLARTLSTAVSDDRAPPPQLDKAHKALLDNLEDGPLAESSNYIQEMRPRAPKRVSFINHQNL